MLQTCYQITKLTNIASENNILPAVNIDEVENIGRRSRNPGKALRPVQQVHITCIVREFVIMRFKIRTKFVIFLKINIRKKSLCQAVCLG